MTLDDITDNSKGVNVSNYLHNVELTLTPLKCNDVDDVLHINDIL